MLFSILNCHHWNIVQQRSLNRFIHPIYQPLCENKTIMTPSFKSHPQLSVIWLQIWIKWKHLILILYRTVYILLYNIQMTFNILALYFSLSPELILTKSKIWAGKVSEFLFFFFIYTNLVILHNKKFKKNIYNIFPIYQHVCKCENYFIGQ